MKRFCVAKKSCFTKELYFTKKTSFQANLFEKNDLSKKLKKTLLPVFITVGLVLGFLLQHSLAFASLDLNTFGDEYAENNAQTNAVLQPFQIKPMATFWGYTGKQTVGRAQALVPLWWTDQTSALFGAVEAAGTLKKHNGYMGGLGLGYRKVISDSYILGGYLLGDYSSSSNNHSFIIANPGFEVLGYATDLRANAYIPLSSQCWYGAERWADDIGIYDFIHFHGNAQYNTKFRSYEEMGYGFDAEIGTTMPIYNDPKVFVGGYHFSRKTLGGVTGIEARIVYPVSRYIAFDIRGTHDNESKNTAMFGVRLTFGGFSPEEKANYGVAARIMDPIEHNLGTIAKGYALPVKTTYTNEGTELLQVDHIKFIKPGTYNSGAVYGSGTYEDPYIGFDQSTLDSIVQDPVYKQYTNLYFATGSYDFGSAYKLVLPANANVYGCDANYRPGRGVDRPSFIGSVDINDSGGNNILDSIIMVNNNGNNPYGVSLSNVSSVYLNNITLGDMTATSGYLIGMQLDNATDIYMSNSTINGYGSGQLATALSLADGSVLNLIGGNNVIANSGSNDAIGIKVDDQSILNLSGELANNNTVSGVTNSDSFSGYGIWNEGTLNIDSYNTVFGSATTDSGGGIGIENNTGQVAIFGDNNVIYGMSQYVSGFSLHKLWGVQGSQPEGSVGIFNYNGDVNISGANNTIYAEGNNDVLAGVEVFGGTLTLSGTSNKVYASTTSNKNAYGIYVSDSGSINISGNANTISATTQMGDVGAAIEARNSSIVNILGNKNIIKVAGNAANYLAGINVLEGSKLYLGDINNPGLYGNTNTISASGVASVVAGINVVGTESEANVSGDGNVVSGTSSSGSGDAMGINVDNQGELVISGAKNTFSGVTSDLNNGIGTGITVQNGSKVTLSGSNNSLSGTSNNDGYGLILQDSQFLLSGSNNSIVGSSSSLTSNSNGIYALRSIISIIGSANSIVGNSGIVLDDTSSTLSISGINNTIKGMSQNSDAIGIFSRSQSVIIGGAGNTIIAYASGNGNASAILGYDSIMNITGAKIVSDSAKGKIYGMNINGSQSQIALSNTELDIGLDTVSKSPAGAIGVYAQQGATVNVLNVAKLVINMNTNNATYGVSSDIDISQTDATNLRKNIIFSGVGTDKDIGPIAATMP
jgi:hypothetical protein